MADFFVSYNKANRDWAVWIAWQLEAAGYETIVQAWDFRPGCNWVLEMQNASVSSDRTIAVLSPDYIGAQFTQPEWAAAFAQDPQGWQRTLIPVHVKQTPRAGLLSQIAYVDLIGLDEPQARTTLLLGVQKGRAKPLQPPLFPGPGGHAMPEFPGPAGPRDGPPSASVAGSPPAVPSPSSVEESLRLFQRVYAFGSEQMQMTRYDAERLAADWIASHAGQDFSLFEDVYNFAVSRMQKTRYDAERFAMDWLAGHGTRGFALFVDAYRFAVDKMQKTRYDAEQFAMERLGMPSR